MLRPRTSFILALFLVCSLVACGGDSEIAGPKGERDDPTSDTGTDPDGLTTDGPADSTTDPGEGEDPTTGGGDDPGEGDDPDPACETDPSLCEEDPPEEEGNPVDDVDGDTILDRDEGNCGRDSDFDRTPDCEDEDSDNDGIPDSVEAGDSETLTQPVDTDRDEVPDYRDLDSDGDGIEDRIEGMADPDGDGAGNWIDTDSDGDNIRDIVEGVTDFDGDGIPDYLDTDSDNDTIADWYEAFGDLDEDGIQDRFDLDSDDDGFSDREEAGDADLNTDPVDTDDDGTADYLDYDSDGDGLLDQNELGCPDSSDRLMPDTDHDLYSDLAEVAVGSDPCNELWHVGHEVEFFFILPPDEEQNAPLSFSTDVQQADILFHMDTTGSMSGEISNLQGGILEMIDDIGAVFDDGDDDDDVESVAFGVSSYRDFPVDNPNSSSDYGNLSRGDYPFRLDQRITTRASSARSGASRLVADGGADIEESGWESLYQIATGAGGVSWHDSDVSDSLGPFNPASGRIVGVADGTIGGVGFREGSLPIVVQFTDARSHNDTLSPYSTARVTGTHYRTQAINQLNARQIRVVGVASAAGGDSLWNELEALAVETGAVIPACAFRGACGANKCCTGIPGESNWAQPPAAGNMCPLAFQIKSDGSGLSDSTVDAIEFLATAGTMRVSTRVVADADAAREGVDTACFIKAVIPNRWVHGDDCGSDPTISDHYPPAGVDDSFDGVTNGTQVFFDVFVENNGCVEPTEDPQAFDATIEVIGDDVTVLDTRKVTIIIPPTEGGGGKI